MIEIRHRRPDRFGEPLLEVRMQRGVQSYPASFKWLLVGFAALCLGVSGGFALVGALPVVGFAGLELVLLFVLLRVSFRRAATEEALELSGEHTIVRRGGPNGDYEAARLQSYWLTVAPARFENQGLILSSRGRSVAIGAGLAAQELRDLAGAIRDALYRAKVAPAGE